MSRCEARHPEQDITCTVSEEAAHESHYHRPTGTSWPNPDFVAPLHNPRKAVKDLADKQREENQDRNTAGARSPEPLPEPEPEPEPALPYRGSSGSNGYGSTSQERADNRDESGLTARFDAEVEAWVLEAREYGRTWKEGQIRFPGEHHGGISGTLSRLHKVGRLMRLVDQRDGCEIYVGPDFVNGRQVVRQGNPTLNEMDDWLRPDPVTGACRADGNEVAFKEAMRHWRAHLYR